MLRTPGIVLALGLAGVTCVWADLVSDVRAVVNQQDLPKAAALVKSYESSQGQTSESILALSWIARGALAAKKYDEAERYSAETYQRATAALKTRRLERDANLAVALAAVIEVQAQALVALERRSEALAYLDDQLKRYRGTPVHAKIQKNIHLLSLVGKPAPKVQGLRLPAGKPVLLFFWAHWCTDCRAEAPLLARLKKEYEPKGVVFLGATQKYGYVTAGEEAPPAAEVKHIETIRQQFYSDLVAAPAVVNEDNFRNYGVSSTPTLAMVDRRGVVRTYHPGSMTYEELQKAVEGVLKD